MPGGHIEDGEPARVALRRELREEMGESDYKITSFVGIAEEIFLLPEKLWQHEINIIFAVDVPLNFKIATKEDHIEFMAVAKSNFKNYPVLPAPVKAGVIDWLQNHRPFFSGVQK